MYLKLFFCFADSKFGYHFFLFLEFFIPVSDSPFFMSEDLLYTALRLHPYLLTISFLISLVILILMCCKLYLVSLEIFEQTS